VGSGRTASTWADEEDAEAAVAQPVLATLPAGALSLAGHGAPSMACGACSSNDAAPPVAFTAAGGVGEGIARRSCDACTELGCDDAMLSGRLCKGAHTRAAVEVKTVRVYSYRR